MTKRSKVKYEADPHQYYREPRFCVEQLFENVSFGNALIYDPACGKGNILDVAKSRGHMTVGSDIVDRHSPHRFFPANFIKQTRFPSPDDRSISIICNPPYGTVDGMRFMANRFVKKALRAIDFHRAAFLVPIEFACGQERHAEIYSKRAPSHVLFCCQRPSMPPGLAVEEMGKDAYSGGMADYCWIVWTRGGPYQTEAIFMRPGDNPPPPRDRIIKD